jgi:predicted RNase H-like nuclease
VVALAAARLPLKCELRLCPTFAEVVATARNCAVAVVDVPIGLLNTGGPRECDQQARQRLGAAACRVFNPLPRAALTCADYAECNQRHRQRFGKGISRQSFGLRSRLLEVDRAISPDLQKRIREFYPELVWQRLHHGVPLPSKHTPEGIRMRLALLRGVIANLAPLIASVQRWGRACGVDDALDALAGLELAQRMVQRPPRAERLPERPPRDARGLRMEIWF